MESLCRNKCKHNFTDEKLSATKSNPSAPLEQNKKEEID